MEIASRLSSDNDYVFPRERRKSLLGSLANNKAKKVSLPSDPEMVNIINKAWEDACKNAEELGISTDDIGLSIQTLLSTSM